MIHFMDILERLNLITIAHAASIEDTPVKMETIQSNGMSTVSTFIIFMLTFILISGALLFLFMVVSKKNKLEQTCSKNIRILDRIKMDHNSNLFVLKIQNEVHILGKTDNSITPITSFHDKDVVQQIEIDCAKNQEINFQNVFNEQLSSINNTTSMYFKNFKSSNSSNSKSFKTNKK